MKRYDRFNTYKKPKELINENINFAKVLVIDEKGNKLGEMSSSQGLILAREHNLDLYCVSPKSAIPVCKICDYGKLKYEQNKTKKEQKKKNVQSKLKEIRIKSGIAENDMKTKARHAIQFLQNGDKVKLSLKVFGRQLSSADLIRGKIDQFLNMIAEYGKPESENLKKTNNFFDVIIVPINKKNKENAHGKNQNENKESDS